MAPEFKKVSLADIPTSLTTLYTTPSNCDTVVIGCLICNKHSSDITVDVMIDVETGISVGGNTNEDVYLVKGVTIPSGSSLDIIDGNKVVLANTSTNTGDALRILASNTNADVLLSILENT